MQYKITYEAEAEKALEEIFAYYIDQVGCDLASRIIDTMTEAIDSLYTMPNRCQNLTFPTIFIDLLSKNRRILFIFAS